MAHRGPLREVFGMLCIALIFPKVEKTTMPTPNTGYIIDAIEVDEVHNITVPPLTTPPNTGILPFILTFLTMILSILGEDLLNTAAMYMLNRMMPLLAACFGFITRKFIKKNAQKGPSKGQKLQPVDHELEYLRAASTHDAAQMSGLKGKLSKSEGEKQEAISQSTQAEAAKSQAIARITREKSKEVANLKEIGDELMATMRDAVDPEGLHPKEDIFRLAKDLRSDKRRISKKLQRQKKELEKARDVSENGQLAEKDEQITRLSTENTRLNSRILGLEQGQLHSVQAVEDYEKSAREREKRLKDRTSAAENTARQAISQRQYDAVRDQLEGVVGELREVRQERADAIDAQGRLSTDLEAERARTQELQTMADNEVEARQQSEDRLTTVTDELQLANNQIANFEREALAKDQEVRDAEQKARAAETNVVENTTTVSELEQSLQEAQNQAKEWREGNEELALKLQRTEEALKKKNGEAEPAAADNASNENFITEINDLRLQLAEANERATNNFQSGYMNAMSQHPPDKQSEGTADPNPADNDQKSVPDSQEAELRSTIESLEAANKDLQNDLDARQVVPATDLEKESSYQQGYDTAINECNVQATTMIDNKVQKEVAEMEQAARASFQEKWNTREAEWTANFDAACNERVRTTTAESQQALQGQLNQAIQRATRAEFKVNNPEGYLKEAQDDARMLYAKGSEHWKRAEREKKRADEAEEKAKNEAERAKAAEEKVGKYKTGKESQDGRIKALNEEVTKLKRTSPQQSELKTAEIEAMENDQMRANAIIGEFLRRAYDFSTRKVVVDLMKANDKIAALKLLLKKPTTKPNQIQFSKMLLDAEVDQKSEYYLKMDRKYRQVLVRQCTGVNATLMALKGIISASDKPDKQRLLVEICKPRGDEGAEWDMEDVNSGPSSDEDEDDNDNAPTPAVDPRFRPKALPTGPRNRPSQQAEGQDTPVSGDANTENPLKRKGNGDDMEPDGSGKRKDTSNMGMRPIGGPSPQQE